MVGIVIATHGDFAHGIKQSGSMLFGEQEMVESIAMTPSEGPEALQEKMREVVSKFPGNQVLFLIDLWGGSPFNQASILYKEDEENRAIVTGLNLPMLIEAYSVRAEMDTAHEIATYVVSEGRRGVKILPSSLMLQDLPPPEGGAPSEENLEGEDGAEKSKNVFARLFGK